MVVETCTSSPLTRGESGPVLRVLFMGWRGDREVRRVAQCLTHSTGPGDARHCPHGNETRCWCSQHSSWVPPFLSSYPFHLQDSSVSPCKCSSVPPLFSFSTSSSPATVTTISYFSSVQFSRSVVSDSLRPHGLQHARPPCPSPTPRAYSSSSPLSWWCHPTISSSVVPFSSCLQSFPASGSFQMSQFFTSGGQSIRVLASASVLQQFRIFRANFLYDGLVGSRDPRDSQQSSPTSQFKSTSSLVLSFLYSPTLTSIHDYHSFD